MSLRPGQESAFGTALARSFRGLSIAAVAVVVLTATAGSEVLLLDSAMVRPAIGYSLTAILGVIFFWGSLRFRHAIRSLMVMALATVILCVALDQALLDGLSGSLLASLGSPGETIYAEHYSGWRFWRVTRGMSREQVIHLLGEPLVECWVYPRKSGAIVPQVVLEKDKVADVELGEDPRLIPIKAGMTRAELLKVTGPPSEVVFGYTKGRNSHQERTIRFHEGRVLRKASSYYVD